MVSSEIGVWVRRHAPQGAVDTYVNAFPPVEGAVPGAPNPLGAPLVRQSAQELIAQMDELGVDRALLGEPMPTAGLSEEDGYRWTREAVQQFPERLSLTVRVDPNELMGAARALERMVRADGAVAVRVSPARVGKPLTDRVYFPLYTKCVELGVPVMATVGLPAPKIPGLLQHPEHLDELCYLWPELTVISTHGGEPWSDVLVALMAKWPNLYHVISAFAPKYYPAAIVKFLNSSRGRSKVMFGTDHPYMPMARVLAELTDSGISEGALPAFLSGNARALFFKPQQ